MGVWGLGDMGYISKIHFDTLNFLPAKFKFLLDLFSLGTTLSFDLFLLGKIEYHSLNNCSNCFPERKLSKIFPPKTLGGINFHQRHTSNLIGKNLIYSGSKYLSAR